MDVFLRTTSKDIIERSLASLWASCWWEGLRTEKSQGIESRLEFSVVGRDEPVKGYSLRNRTKEKG